MIAIQCLSGFKSTVLKLIPFDALQCGYLFFLALSTQCLQWCYVVKWFLHFKDSSFQFTWKCAMAIKGLYIKLWGKGPACFSFCSEQQKKLLNGRRKGRSGKQSGHSPFIESHVHRNQSQVHLHFWDICAPPYVICIPVLCVDSEFKASFYLPTNQN